MNKFISRVISKYITVMTYHNLSRDQDGHIFLAKMCQKKPKSVFIWNKMDFEYFSNEASSKLGGCQILVNILIRHLLLKNKLVRSRFCYFLPEGSKIKWDMKIVSFENKSRKNAPTNYCSANLEDLDGFQSQFIRNCFNGR